jgi:hypothetical protein
VSLAGQGLVLGIYGLLLAAELSTAGSYKTVDLKVRPIYHYLAERSVRTSFSACSPIMSSGTCGKALAPLLFVDESR